MAALYEVVLRGTLFERDWLARFHYQVVNAIASPTALELLTKMGFIPTGDPAALPDTGLFQSIRELVSQDVVFVEVEARELYSVTDFYVAPFDPGVVGLYAAAASAGFLAFGFYSNRTRTDIRRAFKRFPGVCEAQIGNQGAWEAATATIRGNVATALGAQLEGTSAFYDPVVVSLHKTEVGGVVVSRELYETRDEQLAHVMVVTEWVSQAGVTTQNSRKK